MDHDGFRDVMGFLTDVKRDGKLYLLWKWKSPDLKMEWDSVRETTL
jgi:hypothetical protein